MKKEYQPINGAESPARSSSGQQGRARGTLLANVAVASVCSCLLGYDIGVTSGAIVLIQEDMGLSTLQVAIVTSSMNAAAIPGSLIGGFMADSVGRRRSLGLVSLVFMVGALVQSLASDLTVLLAGRVFAGLGVGGALVVSPMYIAELVPTERRGQLVSVNETLINVGILLGYVANSTLLSVRNNWRWMLGIGFGIGLVLLIGVCWCMQESPRWLCAQGRADEALGILQGTTSSDEEATDQLQACIAAAAEFEESGAVTEGQAGQGSSSIGGWGEIFSPTPIIRRILIAGLGVSLFQQLTGIEAIM